MTMEIPIFLTRCFVVFLLATIVLVNARPPQFGETNQLVPERENNNLLDSGLKPWQMELLVQRLAEVNNNSPAANLDFDGFERGLRSRTDIKRQSRYRLCYFNPVSCFRK